MKEGSCIKRVMDIGRELVTDFLTTDQIRTRTTPLTNGYHLVFAKVWDHAQINACLYDFQVSCHPILVFGPDVYDPRLPDIEASIWLGFAESARRQFVITKSLDTLITTAARKGTRVASRAGNLDESICEPGIARARKDTGVISESNPPESLPLTPPVKPTPPPVRVIKNEKVIAGKLSDK